SRPYCEAAHAFAYGDVGPVIALAEAPVTDWSREGQAARDKIVRLHEWLKDGRVAIGGVAPGLRLLLEAKDCAVRAAVLEARREAVVDRALAAQDGEVTDPPALASLLSTLESEIV